MFKNISKNTKIILLVINLILIILLVFFVFRFFSLGNNTQTELSYLYQKSVGEVSENLADIENVFEKAKYVSTPTGQFSIASNLLKSSSSAKSASENLPFTSENSEKIEKSLSLVSDFALYIERQSVSMQTLNEEDLKALETLQKHVEIVKNEFDNMLAKISDGTVTVGETQDILKKSVFLPDAPNFDDNLTGLNKLATLPIIEYDGSFSAHIDQLNPKYLQDKDEISKEDALDIASEFLQIDKDSLTVKYQNDTNLAFFQISAENNSIHITKLGGEILYFKKTMDIESTKIDFEAALQNAKNHLENLGFTDIKENYYVINDNVCAIDFVAVQDDVLLYTDTFTVSIDLNEGSVMEYTSKGYLMNNYKRENLSPTLSEDDAKKSISDKLAIEKTELAIIPSAGLKEILTYEFTAVSKDTNQEFIIYINAETGFEEQIFMLNKTDNSKNIA